MGIETVFALISKLKYLECNKNEEVFLPFIMSGPMVDSMILSIAEPRSEDVEAVESETIIPPSETALECTRTWTDSETRTDCVTVETLDTLVD